MMRRLLIALTAVASVGLVVAILRVPSIRTPEESTTATSSDDISGNYGSSGLLDAMLATSSAVAAPSSAPPVAWSPSSLTVTMSPGETKTVEVTATMRSAIPATDVRLVPALTPYATVFPPDLPRLGKGATQNFILSFAVPSDAAFQTVTGTVRLVSGTTTIAQPLPITLRVWQQVFSAPLDISFHVPPDIHVMSADQAGTLTLGRESDPSADATEDPLILIKSDENPHALSIEDFYDGDPGEDLFGQSEGIFTTRFVGDRVAHEFVTITGNVLVVVPRSSNFLLIADLGTAFQATGSFGGILETMVIN